MKSSKPEMPESMVERCPSCTGEGVDRTRYRSKVCEECEGEGLIEEVTCDVCEGGGCDYCVQTGKLHNVPCPTCEQTGEVEFHPYCKECNGSGIVPSKKFLNV